MSESRDHEARSWAEEGAGGEGLVVEMKRAVARLREQLSDYRERTGDNDNGEGEGGELTPAD